jgi:hypothetical protein
VEFEGIRIIRWSLREVPIMVTVRASNPMFCRGGPACPTRADTWVWPYRTGSRNVKLAWLNKVYLSEAGWKACPTQFQINYLFTNSIILAGSAVGISQLKFAHT